MRWPCHYLQILTKFFSYTCISGYRFAIVSFFCSLLSNQFSKYADLGKNKMIDWLNEDAHPILKMKCWWGFLFAVWRYGVSVSLVIETLRDRRSESEIASGMPERNRSLDWISHFNFKLRLALVTTTWMGDCSLKDREEILQIHKFSVPLFFDDFKKLSSVIFRWCSG